MSEVELWTELDTELQGELSFKLWSEIRSEVWELNSELSKVVPMNYLHLPALP